MPNHHPNHPVTFHEAFEEELARIERSRALRLANAVRLPKPKDSLIGLAFSGGGIRSATFNLGILQALAENSLLHKFDYLSTVSGGGYIGSWLAALTRRFTATTGKRFTDLERILAPTNYERGKRKEATFLHWLRMYSNYLTPHKGFLSGDTWAMVGTWLRNVFLNQIILGLIFIGVFVVCHGGLLFLVKTEEYAPWFIGLGGASLCLAAVLMAINVVDLSGTEEEPRNWFGRTQITVTVVVPFVLASVLLNGGLWQWLDLASSPMWQWCAMGAGVYFLTWLVAAFIARLSRLIGPSQRREGKRMVSLLAFLLWSPIAGAIGALLLREYNLVLGHLPLWTAPFQDWVVAILGSGIVMLVLLITGTLHIGLVGRANQDLVREWWARLGGYLMLVTMGWLLLAGACAVGPLLIRWAIFKLSGWKSVTAAVLWIANNYLGVKAANSARTSGKAKKTSTTQPEVVDKGDREGGSNKTKKVLELFKSPQMLELAAKVAPYIFAVGLMLLFSTLVHIGVGFVFDSSDAKYVWQLKQGPKTVEWQDLSDTYWAIQESANYLSLVAFGTVMLLGGILFSLRIDVNEFSLHHFYRNRLVRCYLGASNPDRSPQAFTKFDPNDDLPLKVFARDYPGPYPILNATLNITSGENLGYTTRRAKSFAFTPLYCGYDQRILGRGVTRFSFDDGYAPSFALAADGRTKNPLTRRDSEDGINLGTAMAISGAAASPNMGYFSSPATAFFMTLFDVRLGWWMGNPRCRNKWRSLGPALGIKYLFYELLGQSDQNKNYVYLSDGGHFENLGVYELIKRHCRVIVACDADCDAKYQFENLIGLIEKARTDFGARIEIDFARIRPKNGRESEHNFALGTICYNPQDEKDQGKLIYIKASMPKRERRKPPLPDDVWHYFDVHSTFPHESTADQWFDELQFESYRALGEFVGKVAAEEIRDCISYIF